MVLVHAGFLMKIAITPLYCICQVDIFCIEYLTEYCFKQDIYLYLFRFQQSLDLTRNKCHFKVNSERFNEPGGGYIHVWKMTDRFTRLGETHGFKKTAVFAGGDRIHRKVCHFRPVRAYPSLKPEHAFTPDAFAQVIRIQVD